MSTYFLQEKLLSSIFSDEDTAVHFKDYLTELFQNATADSIGSYFTLKIWQEALADGARLASCLLIGASGVTISQRSCICLVLLYAILTTHRCSLQLLQPNFWRQNIVNIYAGNPVRVFICVK